MNDLLLADNQSITNIGLQYLVKSITKDAVQISTSSEKSELIKYLYAHPAAAIILDYTLFDFSSQDELMILSERYPLSSWLLFSEDLSDGLLHFISANELPFSIVLKSCSQEEIELGIDAILNKKIYVCQRTQAHVSVLNKSFDGFLENANLTVTEKEILKEIALGKTTKEIASDRILSFHTIITHRKNIFRKLGVNNVHEATKYAMRAGIVDVSEYYI